jgi:hypothetical protein
MHIAARTASARARTGEQRIAARRDSAALAHSFGHEVLGARGATQDSCVAAECGRH